jgi:hypothetical protein
MFVHELFRVFPNLKISFLKIEKNIDERDLKQTKFLMKIQTFL